MQINKREIVHKKTVICVHTAFDVMKTATNVRMMEMVGRDEFCGWETIPGVMLGSGHASVYAKS